MLPNGSSAIAEEEAILQWVKSFDSTRSVDTLQELSDGQVLWEILREIDGDWFTDKLPSEDQSDEAKRLNIQFIRQHIERSLDATGQRTHGLHGEEMDRSVAAGSTPDIRRFIRSILVVMLGSPKLAEHLSRIQSLPTPAMQVIGGLMQELSGWDAESDSRDTDSLPSPQGARNVDEADKPTTFPDPRTEVLQLEAQYATIVSQLERRNRDYDSLDTEHQSLSDSLTRLQETNDALTTQIVERDDQLKRLRNLETQREESSVRELELKISQQEEVIGSRELDFAKSENALNELQRENKRLLGLAQRYERLQDEYDATKMELEKQSRKANTADKYMQKLQASHSIERERDTLRQDLSDVRKQLSRFDNLQRENKALQRANEEVSQTLAQIEREDEELRMTNKKLRMSCDSYEQQMGWLTERNAQDQETIMELKDLQETRASPTTPTGASALENEISDSTQQANNVQARLGSLEAEKQKLASEKTEDSASLTALQEKLAAAQASNTNHYEQLQKYRQDNLALQASLAQVQRGHPIEGTEVFKRMRDQLKVVKEQKVQLEETLATATRNQEGLVNDHSLSDTEQPDALADRKDEHREEMSKLKDELYQLKHFKENLQSDYDNLAEQLRQKRQDETPDLFTEHELRELLAITTARNNSETLADSIIAAIYDARKRASNVEKPNHRNDLGRILREILGDTISSRDPSAPPARDSHVYIQNLERENRLIASQYHDLAGRLQLNNVTLQRRSDAPKSWLGRQRKAFDGPIGLAR